MAKTGKPKGKAGRKPPVARPAGPRAKKKSSGSKPGAVKGDPAANAEDRHNLDLSKVTGNLTGPCDYSTAVKRLMSEIPSGERKGVSQDKMMDYLRRTPGATKDEVQPTGIEAVVEHIKNGTPLPEAAPPIDDDFAVSSDDFGGGPEPAPEQKPAAKKKAKKRKTQTTPAPEENTDDDASEPKPSKNDMGVESLRKAMETFKGNWYETDEKLKATAKRLGIVENDNGEMRAQIAALEDELREYREPLVQGHGFLDSQIEIQENAIARREEVKGKHVAVPWRFWSPRKGEADLYEDTITVTEMMEIEGQQVPMKRTEKISIDLKIDLACQVWNKPLTADLEGEDRRRKNMETPVRISFDQAEKRLEDLQKLLALFQVYNKAMREQGRKDAVKSIPEELFYTEFRLRQIVEIAPNSFVYDIPILGGARMVEDTEEAIGKERTTLYSMKGRVEERVLMLIGVKKMTGNKDLKLNANTGEMEGLTKEDRKKLLDAVVTVPKMLSDLEAAQEKVADLEVQTSAAVEKAEKLQTIAESSQVAIDASDKEAAELRLRLEEAHKELEKVRAEEIPAAKIAGKDEEKKISEGLSGDLQGMIEALQAELKDSKAALESEGDEKAKKRYDAGLKEGRRLQRGEMQSEMSEVRADNSDLLSKRLEAERRAMALNRELDEGKKTIEELNETRGRLLARNKEYAEEKLEWIRGLEVRDAKNKELGGKEALRQYKKEVKQGDHEADDELTSLDREEERRRRAVNPLHEQIASLEEKLEEATTRLAGFDDQLISQKDAAKLFKGVTIKQLPGFLDTLGASADDKGFYRKVEIEAAAEMDSRLMSAAQAREKYGFNKKRLAGLVKEGFVAEIARGNQKKYTVSHHEMLVRILTQENNISDLGTQLETAKSELETKTGEYKADVEKQRTEYETKLSEQKETSDEAIAELEAERDEQAARISELESTLATEGDLEGLLKGIKNIKDLMKILAQLGIKPDDVGNYRKSDIDRAKTMYDESVSATALKKKYKIDKKRLATFVNEGFVIEIKHKKQRRYFVPNDPMLVRIITQEDELGSTQEALDAVRAEYDAEQKAHAADNKDKDGRIGSLEGENAGLSAKVKTLESALIAAGNLAGRFKGVKTEKEIILLLEALGIKPGKKGYKKSDISYAEMVNAQSITEGTFLKRYKLSKKKAGDYVKQKFVLRVKRGKQKRYFVPSHEKLATIVEQEGKISGLEKDLKKAETGLERETQQYMDQMKTMKGEHAARVKGLEEASAEMEGELRGRISELEAAIAEKEGLLKQFEGIEPGDIFLILEALGIKPDVNGNYRKDDVDAAKEMYDDALPPKRMMHEYGIDSVRLVQIVDIGLAVELHSGKKKRYYVEKPALLKRYIGYEDEMARLGSESKAVAAKLDEAIMGHKADVFAMVEERKKALDACNNEWKESVDNTYYRNLFEFARWAREAGKYDTALEWLQDVEQSNRFVDPMLEFEMGLVQMAKGNLPEATARFGVVLSLDGTDENLAAYARHNLHCIFSANGDSRAQEYVPMDTQGMKVFPIGVPQLKKADHQESDAEPAGFFG